MKKSSVAVGFVGIACATVVLVMTRPAYVHVERSARIDARAGALYPLVEDFAGWSAWSPWQELTSRCTSQTAGPGASCEGGTARLTIVSVEPDARVDYTIEFPTQTTEVARLSVVLAPVGESTDVTWSFDSSSSFGEDTLGGPQDLEARLGSDFEDALARLARASTGPTDR